MKKLIYLMAIVQAVLFVVSCKDKEAEDQTAMPVMQIQTKITGDSMIYGLVCDGTGDSSVVLYPFSGADPITYSCIDAKRNGKIIGQLQIGDWIGLVKNKEDTTVANMVIDLDQLKGTWTYPVLPVWKDLKNMSKKMQQRMANRVLVDIPDSVKNLYFIPREYGFSLKRGSKAQPVGRVMTANTLEDDSPVEYPAVKNYQEWHPWNGKLILISAERMDANAKPNQRPKETVDTLEFISLDNDSLVLTLHGIRYGFHRKESAITANSVAQKAAQKADKETAKELTK